MVRRYVMDYYYGFRVKYNSIIIPPQLDQHSHIVVLFVCFAL
jgi:hypothetical protein